LGDFCRVISTSDGSNRVHAETCVPIPGTPLGSCKQGLVTANTTCSTLGVNATCQAPGDFCIEGQPAKMCADTGLWCATDTDCAGSEKCVAATSRMMITKRALRRAITANANKINFGFMNTYQGKGIGGTNPTTEIFPYVRLQSCSGLTTITETKFLARGELERGLVPSTSNPCFDLTNGPRSSCTIDYGGNGAINNGSAGLNQVTYTLVNSNNSRWAIPRGDGSGKSNHADPGVASTSWSDCASSTLLPGLPACNFGSQGTGIYEGSYYTFTYSQGTPSTSGAGSRANPVYFPTYKGKYYYVGSSECYNAVDAERTDVVNDGIFGRVAYTGYPYASANEVGVPWGGSTNPGACDATTGAIWNPSVVPFLNTATQTSTDTFTFGTSTITRDQKTLMTTARLEKASFGGVDATGRLAPFGCALSNAQTYMTTVASNDVANNGGKKPCWGSDIVLVVDGWSNGFGDMSSTINCGSNACASATPTAAAGCNCAVINHAYDLAQGSPSVQTHVVVNAPTTWSTRYHDSIYAFLTNLALAGSPGRDGTPSFGTSEDEVYKAISDKITIAAYHFPYTTSVPVAGATTQDPTSLVLTNSTYLYDTSVDYPTWRGNLRAFATASSVALSWDAVTVAASGHPTDWTKRRVFFSGSDGTVSQVQIASDGTIGNSSALHTAGLGANSAEAQAIIQWQLGKPGLGNPTPLMGSITSSTPIAVGQPAANGLNGATQYSANKWKRPELIYVGADDGMLHAFFAQAYKTTYAAGEEAFAFIPNDMLPVITKLYLQGGQKLAADRSEHIFGLAASPKVKDMCLGTGCATSTGSDWHTVLVMPEGPGGNHAFALDITNVVDSVNGLQPSLMSLLWSSAPAAPGSNSAVRLGQASDGDKWAKNLGETTSVPAFYYSSVAPNNRVLFASGYPTVSRSVSGYDHQGLAILNVDAELGNVVTADSLTLPTTTCTGHTQTAMADVALARDYSSVSTSQNLMAAYVVDTSGNTFQYVPSKALSTLYALGCSQPLYFAPAVVQLDRVLKDDTTSKHFIYLAQVTNSNLDPDTG
jgi:hypothetical protein